MIRTAILRTFNTGFFARTNCCVDLHTRILARCCSSQDGKYLLHERDGLYDHMTRGILDKIEFDVEDICRNVDSVAKRVRDRKGEMQEDEVYRLVDLWQESCRVRAKVDQLQEQRQALASQAKSLAKSQPNSDEFKDMQVKGRQLRQEFNESSHTETELNSQLYDILLRLPNSCHPSTPVGDESQARLVEMVGEKPSFTFVPRGHLELAERLNILQLRHLANVSGHRSYYLKGAGAQLQHALVQFTQDRLYQQGFTPLVVPDFFYPAILEGCGMMKAGAFDTQIYTLDSSKHEGLCLAGTAEVGIAGMYKDHVLRADQLPQKAFAVSTCYRAETWSGSEPYGIYRVHHFTKIEMFGVTANDHGTESERMQQEFVSLQKDLYSELGLCFHILDMPTQELGLSAHRKYDVEVWMPGRDSFGEVSSASNCTDYQSKRLHIRYETDQEDPKYAHTVNATACAVPRLIVAILENFQQEDGSVVVPQALQPYMGGRKVITALDGLPMKYMGRERRMFKQHQKKFSKYR
ncbi:PREDICTED: serine--tRNA ligase, mitochondrial-like isoform X1 [Branchiostoma belcheri]|uniref:serine--tRNA ligase n=2 Tax=Branchiostoma belcheri TaxID=7741 RepID=A0A6P4Y3V4_BRABE|nr:PREDICTED: serine--tRNA ligase, mitochondrial-like isoform X1 [Branchiostoma belcheri]